MILEHAPLKAAAQRLEKMVAIHTMTMRQRMMRRQMRRQRTIRQRLRASFALLAMAIALAPPASATLGGDGASVAADQAHVKGTLAVAAMPNYVVHEVQAPSGTVVREFVSPAGTVFGIAWQGPTMPDLRQMLGPYFDRYVEAAAARGYRGPLAIELPGLVVQSGGHMRSFAGRAYVPEAVPKGVAADEIR